MLVAGRISHLASGAVIYKRLEEAKREFPEQLRKKLAEIQEEVRGLKAQLEGIALDDARIRLARNNKGKRLEFFGDVDDAWLDNRHNELLDQRLDLEDKMSEAFKDKLDYEYEVLLPSGKTKFTIADKLNQVHHECKVALKAEYEAVKHQLWKTPGESVPFDFRGFSGVVSSVDDLDREYTGYFRELGKEHHNNRKLLIRSIMASDDPTVAIKIRDVNNEDISVNALDGIKHNYREAIPDMIDATLSLIGWAVMAAVKQREPTVERSWLDPRKYVDLVRQYPSKVAAVFVGGSSLMAIVAGRFKRDDLDENDRGNIPQQLSGLSYLVAEGAMWFIDAEKGRGDPKAYAERAVYFLNNMPQVLGMEEKQKNYWAGGGSVSSAGG